MIRERKGTLSVMTGCLFLNDLRIACGMCFLLCFTTYYGIVDSGDIVSYEIYEMEEFENLIISYLWWIKGAYEKWH